MLIRTIPVLIASLSLAQAQSFPVEEQSTYRVIDPTGSTLSSSYANFVLPGVGVGNTIFSTNPLPHKKEAAYANVKTEFTAQEVLQNGFHARDFLPGRTGDLIKHIETRHPGFKFVKKYTRIEYAAPGGRYEKMEAEDRLNPTTLLWSSRLTDFHPQNDYPAFPVIQALNQKPGRHVITMTTYLVFLTSESREVTEVRNGVVVKEKVPLRREVAIAHGKATITR